MNEENIKMLGDGYAYIVSMTSDSIDEKETIACCFSIEQAKYLISKCVEINNILFIDQDNPPDNWDYYPADLLWKDGEDKEKMMKNYHDEELREIYCRFINDMGYKECFYTDIIKFDIEKNEIY